MPEQNQVPVMVPSNLFETEAIQKLEQILGSSDSHPRLVGGNGETIPLPESIYQALRHIVRAMAEGKAISLTPSDHELTSQEAAEMLNVSRPYVVDKLLKQGILPYTKVGNRHRILFSDVADYKRKRDLERRQNLRKHTEFLQDQGFYDE